MAKERKSGNLIGSWAFLIGVILAVVFGFIGIGTAAVWILVILGLIIGLLNIADEETTPFLMSGAVLVIVGALGADTIAAAGSIPYLVDILQALLLLFVPATIIVAIKNVFSLARA